MAATFTLVAKACPGAEAALTNCVFLHPTEHASLLGGAKYVEVGGIVLSAAQHPGVAPGSIGFSQPQRRCARLNLDDQVTCRPYSLPAGRRELGATTAVCTIEYLSAKGGPPGGSKVDGDALGPVLASRFAEQVWTVGQELAADFDGVNYRLTVQDVTVDGKTRERGLITAQTAFAFEAMGGIKLARGAGAGGGASFSFEHFNFQKLGIGGLDREFSDIFRRAFASRVFPPAVVQRMGINHVKGMLLHGPPGTGKTLIARQIGKLLNGRDPKVVNGPEILNKYVGQSEENIRALFADAESEYASRGDDSDLHIIIFDEIDAICKQRGTTGGGTGVGDTVVNQLLTKMDGVDALNNILVIGMTNRKDMIDEALLRPGRFEVHIEIGLPDEAGRLQILKIHTAKMVASNHMDGDVSLDVLATRTRNFSGAEIEGMVKSAASFALARQVDESDLKRPGAAEGVLVSDKDFDRALSEVRPAFGAATDELGSFARGGLVPHGARFEQLRSTLGSLVQQARASPKTPLLTCLLSGAPGAGKTALAATAALASEFPFAKVVSPQHFLSMGEAGKCAALIKAFQDSYRSPLSLLVLDDIERLLEYVAIGPRFSNAVLQTLLVLLKQPPPAGRKLLVIGTTSQPGVLDAMDATSAFDVQLEVPRLDADGIRAVLAAEGCFADVGDVERAAACFAGPDGVAVKKLLTIVEMARQRTAEAIAQRGEDPDAPSSKGRVEFADFAESVADVRA